MSARDAVIVEAVRAPVGRRGGSLASVHPVDLSAHVLTALVERAGLAPDRIDDVIWGCVQQVGAQSFNIGRNAVLAAGWPQEVPATTIDRQCGSSQQAVHFAAAGLIAGQYDVVVVGGVEAMSTIPMGAALGTDLGFPYPPSVLERYGVTTFNQGIGAEMMAQKWALTREACDTFASQSHARLAAATDSGALAGQLVPVPLADGSVLSADEGLRRGTTVESLSGLKPVFQADGVIHAGNSSQISDGAAALLMMTSAKAAELGLTPIARFHSGALAGDDPVMMLSAPIPATQKVLQRSGLSLEEIGVYEVNEAFAPVPMAWLAETGADPARLNPNGGAIAIGHPLGATGVRLALTLARTLARDDAGFGIASACIGGGQGTALLLQRC